MLCTVSERITQQQPTSCLFPPKPWQRIPSPAMLPSVCLRIPIVSRLEWPYHALSNYALTRRHDHTSSTNTKRKLLKVKCSLNTIRCGQQITWQTTRRIHKTYGSTTISVGLPHSHTMGNTVPHMTLLPGPTCGPCSGDEASDARGLVNSIWPLWFCCIKFTLPTCGVVSREIMEVY